MLKEEIERQEKLRKIEEEKQRREQEIKRMLKEKEEIEKQLAKNQEIEEMQRFTNEKEEQQALQVEQEKIEQKMKEQKKKLDAKIEIKTQKHAKTNKPELANMDFLDEEVGKALKIIDNLLEKLPEEVITEFIKSKDFEIYERVLNKYSKK